MSKLHIPQNTAYLITSRANIKYLTNFMGSSAIMLLTNKKSYLITDFRYGEEAKINATSKIKAIVTPNPFEWIKETLGKKEIPSFKTLYFEEENLTYKKFAALKKYFPKIKIAPQSGLIENLRATKTPEEIKLITKSQRINEKTFKQILKNIKPGVTETEIAWEIIKIGRENGAEDVSFPPIVAFGKNSSRPHHKSGNTKLEKGDIVLIDMGMKYKGYCSDMTRVIFTQKPTAKQKEVFETVLSAQQTAFSKIKQGMTGKKADSIARKHIEKQGFGKEFGHSLGHGTGLEIHEAPFLSEKYPQKIPSNSIITLEPGIYLENSFGIRIEDMVLVSGDKSINITKTPKRIILKKGSTS